ncbi:helix-turn-helix domain-containing protein [Leucobacter sp. NPDC058333]|uniref:helix-turn-helix domain-containing protein n=1 Tax=Leucobacter sp. NPDC058333 TaxID=3346450 RepID=UPI003649FC21
MKQQTQPPGVAIKALREMASMTLKEVATGADTSVSYLSKVENGVFHPTQTYVARVVGFISSSMLRKAA